MNIEKNKIIGKDNKEIEIMNLKLDEETSFLNIKQKGINNHIQQIIKMVLFI